VTELYQTGTIAVSAAGTGVVGTGTTWLPTNVKAGDVLNVAGHVCIIEEVVDSTHLTLAIPYPGSTASGLSYAIAKTSAAWGTNREVAVDTARLIQLLTTGQLFEWVIAFSHEDGVISNAVAVVTVPIPKDVTVEDLSAFLNEPSTSGNVVLDLNVNGVSVLSTKLTVNQDENSSDAAGTTAFVLTQPNWNKGDVLTLDVDTAGLNAAGGKLTISGQRRN
jgi:hypothetical protein